VFNLECAQEGQPYAAAVCTREALVFKLEYASIFKLEFAQEETQYSRWSVQEEKQYSIFRVRKRSSNINLRSAQKEQQCSSGSVHKRSSSFQALLCTREAAVFKLEYAQEEEYHLI
jgi:hypothetical protein